MALSDVIKNLIHSTYDICCLCLRSLSNDEQSFNIFDEVALDQNHTQAMFQILSYVVHDAILQEIVNIFSYICHPCTELAISSYKFAQRCQVNAYQLWNIARCLNTCIEKNCRINGDAPLYISLNINKFDIELCDDSKSINDSFLKIQCESENIYNNSTCSRTDECLVTTIKQEHQEDTKLLEEKPLPYKKINKCNRVSKNDEIRDKTDLMVYKCKICKNVYSRGSNLKKHYLGVHAPKVHKCLICPKSFGSVSYLKEHHKHQHTHNVSCCMECGKTYKSIIALQNHEKRHKSRLVCQHCGKVYKTRQAFKSHIEQTHSGLPIKAKPKFICDHCGKSYSEKSGLRVHLQFEHGHRKFFECEWCKKRLRSLGHLKEHINTHTKDKPFSCILCGGKFSTKKTLLYHSRRHTGEKPYRCDHCDRSFISASRRMDHVKQHHLPAELQCDVCLKEFKLKKCLVKHKLKHFESKH